MTKVITFSLQCSLWKKMTSFPFLCVVVNIWCAPNFCDKFKKIFIVACDVLWQKYLDLHPTTPFLISVFSQFCSANFHFLPLFFFIWCLTHVCRFAKSTFLWCIYIVQLNCVGNLRNYSVFYLHDECIKEIRNGIFFILDVIFTTCGAL